MILLFCNYFVFFKLILSPLVYRLQSFDSQRWRYGCPWISICVENHLYAGMFYPIFLLKEFSHLIPFLFILMNYFQFNLIPSWSCLLRKLAWLLGLLHNWRQSIQLETKMSSKSRWSIRSRQWRCWRGIKFILKPWLRWIYHFAAWYPCQLCN